MQLEFSDNCDYYCHDCSQRTVPEQQPSDDHDPLTCGQCGSEYRCDDCGADLDEFGNCGDSCDGGGWPSDQWLRNEERKQMGIGD